MRFQTAWLGLIILFAGIPLSAQAYPWMFFREAERPGFVELDTHVSHFKGGQITALSGIKLNVQIPTININLGYNYSFLEERHYFRMSELAVMFPFVSEEWEMSLGFKDILWSEADRYWNYGLWQSRYMLDAFRPDQMGLPGLYLSYEGDISALFLLSYFYLPDIIVAPKLQGRQITSKNPFFVTGFKNIQWNIGKLELFQIERFFHPVAAFQIKRFIGDSNISFAYAYKPVNQPQYAFLVQGIDLSSEKKGLLKVNDFQYFILSHHLANFEGEIALAEHASLFASLFYESPEKKSYGKGWLSDDFESHLTFSLLAYFQEKLTDESETLFTVGYTKTINSSLNKRASNTVTDDLERFFGRSFIWKEALSASIEHQNTNWLKKVLFRFRANYALDNDFYGLASENYFYLTSRLRMYLSGDLIFRLSERAIPKGGSAIEKYKNLSRVLLGAQYVF